MSSLQYKEKYACTDVERTSEEVGFISHWKRKGVLIKFLQMFLWKSCCCLSGHPTPVRMSIWSFPSYHKECSFEGWKKLYTWRRASLYCTWLLACLWSCLFFICTLYEANGICSWLTSALQLWFSPGLQLAMPWLLVLLNWIRQQQVWLRKGKGSKATGSTVSKRLTAWKLENKDTLGKTISWSVDI